MVRVERYATAGRAVTARGSAGRVPRRYLEPRAGRVPRRANGCAGPVGAHARPLLARKRSEVVIRAAPKTRKPRRNAVPKALCRTRTGDPSLPSRLFSLFAGTEQVSRVAVLQDFRDSTDWAVFADASQMRPTNTVSVTNTPCASREPGFGSVDTEVSTTAPPVVPSLAAVRAGTNRTGWAAETRDQSVCAVSSGSLISVAMPSSSVSRRSSIRSNK